MSSLAALLEHLTSSELILTSFLVLGVLVALLAWVGVLGWLVRLVGGVLRVVVTAGFVLWRWLLSWLPWPLFLLVVLALLGFGWRASLPGWFDPVVRAWAALACGLILLLLGVISCMAYMFLEWERFEVTRGYKALHQPLPGQEPAANLIRHGRRVGLPTLFAATAATVAGFALVNWALYATAGRDWFEVKPPDPPAQFDDFLTYTLINLLRVADVLGVAQSYLSHSDEEVRVTLIRPAHWPAATLLALFRTFFTLLLLNQIVAALRQTRLLGETITDFWSLHPPIHERARRALPHHGPKAVRPLLRSVRGLGTLTAEQRQYLPGVIGAIGPAVIPLLMRHLRDRHESVRAVVVGALGELHALEAVPALRRLADDPSEPVRFAVVEALESIVAKAAEKKEKKRRRRERRLEDLLHATPPPYEWRLVLRRVLSLMRPRQENPVALAVDGLRRALADVAPAVRKQAVQSLGRLGALGGKAVPELIGVLRDGDEPLRVAAAEALGKIGEPVKLIVPALVGLLSDASPAIRTGAAAALGALGGRAAEAVPALTPLLRERDDTVRQTAAEAVTRIGTLPPEEVRRLSEGLAHEDNVVRAQTAGVLGTLGAQAAEAAPALARALSDNSDHVRAEAVQALARMGEAAGAAIPHLVRALKDEDNWVSALAAEALGEIGDSGASVPAATVPALVRSLRHSNSLVRANAAAALGKLGKSAASAAQALEEAARDADGEVRCQAVGALGRIGRPGGVVLSALKDGNPQVRAAAVEALAAADELPDAWLDALTGALADDSADVKIQAVRAVTRLAAVPAAGNGRLAGVMDALTRLLDADTASVRTEAMQALGKFGPAAAAAGPALLQAVQAGDADVRLQALRALTLTQSPESEQAFRSGLKDTVPDIRKLAAAGLMTTPHLSEAALPELIEALRDPESKVRANAARALMRFTPLTAAAVAPLVENAAHADDAVRLAAALALRAAPRGEGQTAFEQLLADPNERIRLLVAGFLLSDVPGHERAAAVLAAALTDPSPRLRKAALELVASLGPAGATFLEQLRHRALEEVEPEVSDLLAELLLRLNPPQPADSNQPAEASATSPGAKQPAPADRG
jgi:HEAT repeat protein